MKIAGGILLIVFGILGICSNLLWGFFFGVEAGMTSLVRQGMELHPMGMNPNDAALAREVIGNVDDALATAAEMGNLGWIFASLLLAFGIIVIATKERWPAIVATVIAFLYIILTLSIATGIPALIGGILAIFGAKNISNNAMNT